MHAKVCVIDDVWAAVGSANLNRRSWTHDSELTAAVLDRTPDGRDPDRGAEALRRAADELDRWHAGGCTGSRPAGRLRRHTTAEVSRTGSWWAPLAVRAVLDPEGRPLSSWAGRRW